MDKSWITPEGDYEITPSTTYFGKPCWNVRRMVDGRHVGTLYDPDELPEFLEHERRMNEH